MAQIEVRVEGARQLRASLKKAGQDLENLKIAHALVANRVSGVAGQMAPKRTGRLAASVRGSGTNTAAVVRAGFASVPYAGPIHWGWPARNIKAQPFLSEAATETQSAWLPIYEQAVEAAIQQVKGA